MALAAGTRLGPYEILEPLGAGGMGEVYRARDPRLKREVALKILPPELASEPERLERFEREAQTLAALNHPHIVTIHSVEEAEGLHFLTMELVEGKTLTRVIPRGGLPLSRFFQIAIPLTEAVSAAHERGITHRDLKPGNVMVTDEGRIKVLDFGLAKLRQEAEATEDSEAPTVPATDTGRVLGTAPYMSPEQVQGKTADHRSDVFSLGIMLYEMVTGERPFQGDTSAELASSILRDTPASVTERKADLPRDLGKLIKHCLEKEPRRRLQSVLDVRNELEELRREVDTGEALTSAGAPLTARRAGGRRRAWLFGGAVVAAVALAVGFLLTRSTLEPPSAETASAERKMLVVLPFENLGPAEVAYFAAGMTEEITSRLARVSGLGVISRTSAVQYDRTGKTTKQIGDDLGVAFVLEGSVRWDRRSEGAGRVRITPQLIRVADDTHLWADSYDRVLDDIFATQSEIAEAVASQLGVALLPEEQQALEARPTRSMEAYEAYLVGRHQFSDPDMAQDSIELAVRMFERAVELDPGFVAAHAMLATAHLAMYWEAYRYDRRPERLKMAHEAVTRALELDPESAEGHKALGYYYYYGQREYERALEEFAKAAERLPNDSDITSGMAFVKRRQGRFEEAITLLNRTVRLEPRNAGLVSDLAETYRLLSRYSEADRYNDLSISLAPRQAKAYTDKAEGYRQRGLLERARATLDSMPEEDDFRCVQAWVAQELWEREYQSALDRLAGVSAEAVPPGEVGWKELLEGELRRLMNQPERARDSYEAARLLLEKSMRDDPDDARARGLLGWAYAGLGRKTDAIREAKHGVELLPVSRDALWGPGQVLLLAVVYTMVGEHDDALDQIEYLRSIPSWWSVWEFRLDPLWDPLRDHPRFKKLVGEDWQAEASP